MSTLKADTQELEAIRFHKFCDALAAEGVVDSEALEDPEGYDNSSTLNSLYRAYGTILKLEADPVQPISSAPKDRPVLVNDACGGDWVMARWLESPGTEGWSGWIYVDELYNDSNPLGPNPTYWLTTPPVPET